MILKDGESLWAAAIIKGSGLPTEGTVTAIRDSRYVIFASCLERPNVAFVKTDESVVTKNVGGGLYSVKGRGRGLDEAQELV